MNKTIHLEIAKPCHENWENMTPVEQGKFCSSCQKQVIDFSRMSDREIALFFKKPSTGSVCGRFMTEQLEHDFEIPRKRIPWVKYFFQFLIPGFLISIRVSAQGIIGRKQSTEYSQIKNENASLEKSLAGKLGLVIPMEPHTSFVSGKVLNERGEAIPFATVTINELTVVADSLGNYEAEIKVSHNNIRIKGSSAGYFSKEIDREATHNRINQDLELKADDVMNEIVVVSYPTQGKVAVRTSTEVAVKQSKSNNQTSCSFKLGEVSSTMIKVGKINLDEKIEPIISEMKLYPNPILTNSTMHIAWNQKETGDFNLQLFNSGGQLVFNKQLYIDEDARVLSVDLPSLTKGDYFVKLVNRSTSKSYTAKVVVQ